MYFPETKTKINDKKSLQNPLISLKQKTTKFKKVTYKRYNFLETKEVQIYKLT
jgi:hypothetical protein